MTSRITNAFVQIFVAIQKRKKIGTKEDETINADFVTELPNHYNFEACLPVGREARLRNLIDRRRITRQPQSYLHLLLNNGFSPCGRYDVPPNHHLPKTNSRNQNLPISKTLPTQTAYI